MIDTVQAVILISALTSAVVTIINAVQRDRAVKDAKRDSEQLHDMVNSRLSQLLEVTRKAAHAAGLAEAVATAAKLKLEEKESRD